MKQYLFRYFLLILFLGAGFQAFAQTEESASAKQDTLAAGYLSEWMEANIYSNYKETEDSCRYAVHIITFLITEKQKVEELYFSPNIAPKLQKNMTKKIKKDFPKYWQGKGQISNGAPYSIAYVRFVSNQSCQQSDISESAQASINYLNKVFELYEPYPKELYPQYANFRLLVLYRAKSE
jgi:hypothetical protein